MMKRLLPGVICVLLMAPAAQAQYAASRTSSPATGHRAEIIPLGGYAWTLAMDVYVTGYNSAQLDFSDEAYYGIALDFNLARPGAKTAQARLMYRRSDGELQFRSSGIGAYNQSIDASIEYWQIGGLGGIQRGNAMPFTCITLGGTRLLANGSDQWKFSMIFGLGVKVYTSPKIGIMIQGNWPITFTDTWGGAYIGTGGASLGISGTGISQLDIGGGLIINL
jgi:opacity protein-like surface antigen